MTPYLLPIMTLALSVLAGLASAQQSPQLPRLYDVTGVAADDTLALRENPRATGRKLGDIAHDATALEVVEISENGDWAHVTLAETNGWASLEYLAPQSRVAGAYLDAPLYCFGTEPFWSLQSDGAGNVAYSHQNDGALSLAMITRAGALGRGSELADLAGDPETATLAISPTLCSDGMSDGLYGITAGLLLRNADGAKALHGCCSLNLP